jgi:hypothetical protein
VVDKSSSVVEEYNVLGDLRQDVFARPVLEHGWRCGLSGESSARSGKSSATSSESLARSGESLARSNKSSVRAW